MHYQAIVDSPIGKLGIQTHEAALTGIDFLPEKTNLKPPPASDYSQAVAQQLQCYFDNPNYTFQVNLKLAVSDFTKRVLQIMQKIPAGQTRSYSDIANQLNSSPRPIGNACRHNLIPIIIPCHRIVAKNGFGGYNGQTQGCMLDIKRWLLQHEEALPPTELS